MKKNVLSNYIRTRLSSVEKHLILYNKNKGEIHIHHLRTDIKKIKAIFSFEKYTETKKSAPKIKSLKPIYHKAGEIRELQMNVHLLRELNKPPKAFISYLKKEELRLALQFCSKIPEYLKAVANFKKKLDLPHKLPKKRSIKKYFDGQIEIAAIFLKNKKQKNNIHHLRMIIKKMLNIYNALPGKLQKNYKLNKEYIKKLEQKAGNWHDTFATIKFLRSKKIFPAASLKMLILKEEKQYRSLLLHLQDFDKKILAKG